MSSTSRTRRFYKLLGELKENVGSRNGMLTRIVSTGLSSGMTCEEVADAFAEADTGTPPLSQAEVARAISRSKEYLTGEANTNPMRFERALRMAESERENASAEERGFVDRMIGVGERMCKDSDNYARDLLKLSPFKPCGFVSVAARIDCATHFIETLFEDGDYIFATDNIHADRDATRIYKPRDMVAWIRREADTLCKVTQTPNCPRIMPTNVGMNAVTGQSVKTSTGKVSFSNKKVLKRRNHMLVEFDMMPKREQTLFWIGAVTTRELDVQTIVYTCNKSLHGVIKVKEAAGDDLFGNVTELAAEQQWRREWQRIARLCCSCDDVDKRCDLSALKDAARLTRFAGGLRDHGMPMPLVWSK